MFYLKEMLQLCIAEEVNLHQIKLKTIRSNQNNIIVAGSKFFFYATYSVQLDWMVRAACYREGDYTNTISPNLNYIEEKGLQIPFKSNCGLLMGFGQQSKTHQDNHTK